ncbi:MAG: hypothetical protein V4733_12335 [Verrucomicrobiota bacterium]
MFTALWKTAVCFALLFFIPAIHCQADDPPETVRTLAIQPDKPAVCALTSKYDGELYRIDITFSGGEVDPAATDLLEVSADGALWTVTATSPTAATARATTYAKDDISVKINVSQKKKPKECEGKGKGSSKAAGEGYANQIQIHAYAPGGGISTLMPRAKAQDSDKTYYGLLAPHELNEVTTLKLQFNSKKSSIGSNSVTLTIPSGCEVVGQPDWEGTKIWDSNTFQTQAINVRLKDGVKSQQVFKLKLQNDLGGEAEDAVTLFPVITKEVWSDQISNVKANGFPDKTGPAEYDYILTGAVSGNSYKLKIFLETGLSEILQKKFIFRTAVGPSASQREIGVSSFIAQNEIQLVSEKGTLESTYLVGGVDANGDGDLSGTEIIGPFKTDHTRAGISTRVPYKFVSVSQAIYSSKQESLIDWAEIALGNAETRNAGRHLLAFCHGIVPQYAGSRLNSISRNEPGLTHPVGVAFSPVAEPGASHVALISKDHEFSHQVVQSNKIRSWLGTKFDSWGQEIRADIVAERQKGDPSALLSYNKQIGNDSVAFNVDIGVFACLGKMGIEGATVRFDVTMYGYVNNVELSGTGKDLYDFDYDGAALGEISSRNASEVQSGYPSLGNGGKVFKTEIDFGGNNPYAHPDVTPYCFY